jgi:hypothetical protein
MYRYVKLLLVTAAFSVPALNAQGTQFNIPRGDLTSALSAYSAQSGVHLMVSNAAINGIRTNGVQGELPPDQALARILSGTGFVPSSDTAGGVVIVRGQNSEKDVPPIHVATTMAPVAGASLETVTVTSSKIGGDVQNIPFTNTALCQ